MFRISHGDKVPYGFSYKREENRWVFYFGLPIWLSKKCSYVAEYDEVMYGLKVKRVLAKLCIGSSLKYVFLRINFDILQGESPVGKQVKAVNKSKIFDKYEWSKP